MYRVLIVDDEEEIRNGLARYFPWSEFGFQVASTAENGLTALEILRVGGIDVVFADIRMPVMSGLELARTLFEDRLAVTVVFLSAYRDFDYAQKAIHYGVKRYILKPTDYRELASILSELKRELDERAEGRTQPDAERNGAPRSELIVGLVREYVLRDYAGATLAGAARIAHLNAHYLSRLYKNTTGEQFKDYLMKVRMEKAAELLLDVGYTTYQVSEIVGYSNPKNFSRSFRRHFGKSPREYRRTPASPSARLS